MDLKLFIATFITIFIAELGDKTQFAAMAASAQSKSTVTVLVAVILALSLAGMIGVFAGRFIGTYFDPQVARYVSGGLFIAVGLWVLLGARN